MIVTIVYFTILTSSCNISFLAGSCFMLIALTEDLKKDLLTFNDAENKRWKIKNKIYAFIEFHSDVKQLSGKL